MSYGPPKRYPLAPLADICRHNYRPTSRKAHEQIDPRNDTAIITAVLTSLDAVPRTTVHKWVAGGGIPEETADRMAVALGYHPLNIWPDWGTREDAA